MSTTRGKAVLLTVFVVVLLSLGAVLALSGDFALTQEMMVTPKVMTA